MKTLTIRIDPVQKDYVVENGAPVQDKGLLTPAYIRMTAPRGGWMYAPDEDWGSDFATLKKNITTSDASNIVDIGERSLKPMIDDGRASDATVEITARSRNNVGLKTTLVDALGENVETFLIPVGAQ